MNKEEILQKSRQEKYDEGLIQAENKGRKIGVFAFAGVLIFITLFNFFTGEPYYEALAMSWAFIAAQAYPKYKFTSNKSYLVTVIAGTIASISYLISHILEVLT